MSDDSKLGIQIFVKKLFLKKVKKRKIEWTLDKDDYYIVLTIIHLHIFIFLNYFKRKKVSGIFLDDLQKNSKNYWKQYHTGEFIQKYIDR